MNPMASVCCFGYEGTDSGPLPGWRLVQNYLYPLRFKIKVTFGHKLYYEIKVTFGEISLKLHQTKWNVAIRASPPDRAYAKQSI
jgi:hypothetical protein